MLSVAWWRIGFATAPKTDSKSQLEGRLSSASMGRAEHLGLPVFEFPTESAALGIVRVVPRTMLSISMIQGTLRRYLHGGSARGRY